MNSTVRALGKVAVFCGSNFGFSDEYAQAARRLGAQIAARGLTLVYGGTHKGLMGIINRRLHDRDGPAT